MIIKGRILLLVFTFIVSTVVAQQSAIDSLFNKLNTLSKKDTTYINTLTAIGVQYQFINVDSMITMGNYIIKQATQINYTKGIAHGYKLKGIAYISLSDKSKALYNDSIALVYYKEANDPIGQGAVYNNMAVLFNATGDFYTAKTYYEKSLEIWQGAGDLKGIGDSHNNLGNNLASLGKYSEALKNLLKGLEIRQKTRDIEGQINSLINIGNLYYYLGDQNKAETYYWASIKLSRKTENFVNSGEIFNNLGALYYSKNQLDSAESYFQKSYDAAKAIEDYATILNAINNWAETKLKKKDFAGTLALLNDAKKYLSSDYNSESSIILTAKFAQYYKELGNYNEAIKYGEKAMKNASEIQSAKLHLETMQLLSEIYAAAKLYDKAYKLQKTASEFSDSLVTEQTLKSISDLQYKYDLEEKENEIAVLEKEKLYQDERNKKLVIAFVLSVFLLTVVSISLYFVYLNIKKQKRIKDLTKKQNETLEQHNQYKNKIFSIIAHDLRSPVASTLTMFNLLKNGIISKEQFYEARHDITNQMRNMNFLLDNLLNWSKNQMKGKLDVLPTHIDIYDIVERNVSLLQDVYYQKNIRIINKLTPGISLFVDRDQIDIVIRNILSNAMKFSRNEGQIVIGEKNNDTTYEISIKDEGLGMDAATMEKLFTPNTIIKVGTNGEQGTGLGLNISKEFVEMNNGQLHVQSTLGYGTTFYIRFKH